MAHDESPQVDDRPVPGDDPRQRPRRSIWLIVIAAIVVLVVYPLSYGPVQYQISMGHLIPLWGVFDVIYAPIEWFANSSEFGEDLVDWYLGVWGA